MAEVGNRYTNYAYRAFVKGQTKLDKLPIEFFRVKSFSINEDILTTATSSIVVSKAPEIAVNGDIIVLYSPKGAVAYKGIISSIDDTTIECNQMQTFYSGTWYCKAPSHSGTISFDNSWLFENFGNYSGSTAPTTDDYEGLTAESTSTIADTDMSYERTSEGTSFLGRYTTYIYCEDPVSVDINFYASDRGSAILNGNVLCSVDDWTTTYGGRTAKAKFKTGWNALVLTLGSGTETNSGWTMDPQISSISGISGLSSVKYNTIPDIEADIVSMLTDYSNGKIRDCTYEDPLIKAEKSTIELSANTTTTANMLTFDDNTSIDLTSWIYSLYEQYGIVLKFDIPYEAKKGKCIVTKPDDSNTVTISNNTKIISDISPVISIEETNKLVIYDSDGTYRTTYVATTEGNVEAPSDMTNRYSKVNTVIVFSDDATSDIIAANLPDNMYNHKVTAVIRINNNIYDTSKFYLGQHFKIYKLKTDNKTDINEYYDTVLTAWSFSKEENEDVKEITLTFGKVRTALTKKLSMGLIK